MSRVISIGSTWLHYKGKHIATVIAIATHTETSEPLVVYECTDADTGQSSGVFARPINVFLAEVSPGKYRFVRAN